MHSPERVLETAFIPRCQNSGAVLPCLVNPHHSPATAIMSKHSQMQSLCIWLQPCIALSPTSRAALPPASSASRRPGWRTGVRELRIPSLTHAVSGHRCAGKPHLLTGLWVLLFEHFSRCLMRIGDLERGYSGQANILVNRILHCD